MLPNATHQRRKGRSVLARADRIRVLEKGTIAQEGDHAALITQAGPYQDAYRLQSHSTSAA